MVNGLAFICFAVAGLFAGCGFHAVLIRVGQPIRWQLGLGLMALALLLYAIGFVTMVVAPATP